MKRKESSSYAFLKYSGLAFQLFALIGIGAWLGTRLDRRLNLETPWFTILLVLLLMTGFFYKLYRDLNTPDES